LDDKKNSKLYQTVNFPNAMKFQKSWGKSSAVVEELDDYERPNKVQESIKKLSSPFKGSAQADIALKKSYTLKFF
jgi:hypothetical protein